MSHAERVNKSGLYRTKSHALKLKAAGYVETPVNTIYAMRRNPKYQNFTLKTEIAGF
jgi:hypothetical protein